MELAVARIGLELFWIPLIAELEFIWIRAREPHRYHTIQWLSISPRVDDENERPSVIRTICFRAAVGLRLILKALDIPLNSANDISD